jgi:hypothetical protein
MRPSICSVADEKKKVIRLEGESYTRNVAGVGPCVFRGASIGLEEDLAWRYRRPFGVNYRQFSNELISGCLRSPKLSVAELDLLPERARAGLRAGVAEACDLRTSMRGLRGSALGGDERLFAAMMWHYQEWTAEFGKLIFEGSFAAANSIKRFVDGMRPQIRKAESGISNILRSTGLLGRLSRSFDEPRLSGLATQRINWPGADRSRLARAVTGSRIMDLDRLKGPTISQSVLRENSHARLSKSPFRQALDASMLRRGPLPNTPRITDFLSSLRIEQGFGGFLKHLEELRREREEVEQLLRRWEGSALEFLVTQLGRRSSRAVLTLDRDALEDAMLDALEAAVRDESLVQELQAAVERCQVLTSSQRHHLKHGLQHASRGEWLDACPPLLNGLEGAFWSAARDYNVVDEKRHLTSRPTKLVRGVESLFKHLQAPAEYVTFLRHQVFGTTANPFRHGDAVSGERRQALFSVAALAGWLDEFADSPAQYELATRLDLHIVTRHALAA